MASNGPGRYRGGGSRPSRPRRGRSESPDPLRPGRSPDHASGSSSRRPRRSKRRPDSPPSTISSSPTASPKAASRSSTASSTTPARPTRRCTTITGPGIAIADVDGDGRLDIYFVNQVGGNQLWRNLGGGRFENITAAAGVAVAGKVSVSASFADIDNDGDADLYVTTVRGGNMLFENDGKGHFKDISAASGLNYTGTRRPPCSSTTTVTASSICSWSTSDGTRPTRSAARGTRSTTSAFEDAFSGHLQPERCRSTASSTTTKARTISSTSRSKSGSRICPGRATPAWSTSTTTAGPISTC